MKKYVCLLISLCLINYLFSQVETYTNSVYEGNSYNAFIVKIDSESIRSFDILHNNSYQTFQDYQATLSPFAPFFLINASISDTLCNPIGLFIKNQQVIQPVNLQDGVGNFYLKPNGALLFTSDKAIICESADIPLYNDIQLGIQSGPMLLVNGAVHAKFNISSTNKLIRCGVGSYSNTNGDNFIVFAISNTPISFYEFSMYFLNKFDCKQAICLESNNCVMAFPNSTGPDENFNSLICNFIYYKI